MGQESEFLCRGTISEAGFKEKFVFYHVLFMNRPIPELIHSLRAARPLGKQTAFLSSCAR